MVGKALKDMSVTELKALGYDLIAQREDNLRQLQEVSQAIAYQLSKPVEATKE